MKKVIEDLLYSNVSNFLLRVIIFTLCPILESSSDSDKKLLSTPPTLIWGINIKNFISNSLTIYKFTYSHT